MNRLLGQQLAAPESLMLLINAVEQQPDNEDAVDRLARLLDVQLPVREVAFGRSLESLAADAHGLTWLAVARRTEWWDKPAKPRLPLVLLSWPRDRTLGTVRGGYSLPGMQQRVEFPPEPGDQLSIADLFAEFDKRFLLICPFSVIGSPL